VEKQSEVSNAEVNENATSQAPRETGKVKFFSDQKGWGFIAREDGRDIFVHYSSIRMEGFRTLHEGDIVTYELLETDRGPQAINVERVSTPNDNNK